MAASTAKKRRAARKPSALAFLGVITCGFVRPPNS